jgi:hypothetical protein
MVSWFVGRLIIHRVGRTDVDRRVVARKLIPSCLDPLIWQGPLTMHFGIRHLPSAGGRTPRTASSGGAILVPRYRVDPWVSVRVRCRAGLAALHAERGES